MCMTSGFPFPHYHLFPKNNNCPQHTLLPPSTRIIWDENENPIFTALSVNVCGWYCEQSNNKMLLPADQPHLGHHRLNHSVVWSMEVAPETWIFLVWKIIDGVWRLHSPAQQWISIMKVMGFCRGRTKALLKSRGHKDDLWNTSPKRKYYWGDCSPWGKEGFKVVL